MKTATTAAVAAAIAVAALLCGCRSVAPVDVRLAQCGNCTVEVLIDGASGQQGKTVTTVAQADVTGIPGI